jgi:hypothetical protein
VSRALAAEMATGHLPELTIQSAEQAIFGPSVAVGGLAKPERDVVVWHRSRAPVGAGSRRRIMPPCGTELSILALSQNGGGFVMRLVDLFVTHPGRSTATFTAPQSLATFPLSICVVATLTRAARTILRTESDAVGIPLATAFLVGAAIVGIVVSDARSRPRTAREWLVTTAVAFVNSLVVFVAALGIDKF